MHVGGTGTGPPHSQFMASGVRSWLITRITWEASKTRNVGVSFLRTLIQYMAEMGFKNLYTYPQPPGLRIIIKFGDFCWRHSVHQTSWKVMQPVTQPVQPHRPLRLLNGLGDPQGAPETNAWEWNKPWPRATAPTTWSLFSLSTAAWQTIPKVSGLK